ncbi:MAG: PD-(D/E)XK nuclease family protein [Clostridia bacterium]|nr:PD-(D/E)XK nuclease family protein [Clostridia bacterium]
MKIIMARPHRLLGEIIRRIGEHARQGESVMLLVPSQYTLQAELEIMERLDISGSFLIDVLSPGRLQSRVFEYAGQPARTAFDERGKRMVLSEIIEQEKERLTVYRAAAEAGTAGFAAKVSALIADFKRSGKTAEEIGAMAETLPRESAARSKLADMARLYAAYEQRMAGELADAEDISQEMRRRLARSGVVQRQHVFVYGFDMITETFARELLAIDKESASLTLAVETDSNSAADGRLFAPVNFSLARLEKLAKETGQEVERETFDAERKTPEDLRALEAGLYALAQPPYEKRPEHIELRAASGVRAEVHLAGARIRRMAADGADLSDMAVVYPKGSGYPPLLESILPMYGVRAYIAQKRPALAHPLCRFLLASLAVVSGGWRTADVVECAQSGFCPLTQEETERLAAYAEGVDLRGEAWKRPFTYVPEEDEETLAALESARRSVVSPLLAFSHALNAARTADDTVEAVISLLDEVGAYDRLLAMREELMAAGFAPEAEDCAQVYEDLMETLDQLHTLLGGKRASADVAGRLLEEGLSALELSALPPADGAVICGEIGNVRTAEVETLFALGMNDAAGGPESTLLSLLEQEEAERATGAYLGMTPSERAAMEQLDELKALGGARRRVIVSYALADETGRALREGTAVQALRRLFPALSVTGGLAQQEQEEMLAAPAAALDVMAVRLGLAAEGKVELTERDRQAYAAIAQTESGREALQRVTRSLMTPPAKRLNASRARALYGRPVMSVSRLETFAQCPYKHFVHYGLAPQSELEPGVDRAQLGTIYHEAVERFTRAVTAESGFPEIAGEICDRLMDEAIGPLMEEWSRSPLGSSRRGEAVARRVAKTARRAGRSIVAQFAGSRFTLMSTEMVFGQNGVAPIALELADGSVVYLQGRIDRIDVLDDGGGTRSIRIVDYKSGAKQFDPTMAYWGIQLQLLLYLAAALAQLPGMRAAGFFYCRIDDPIVKSDVRIKEEVEKSIAKKLGLKGISLSDVEILRAHGGEQAGMVTKDGKPSKRSSASMIDAEGMDHVVDFARRRASELASGAYAGVIDDSPAEWGQNMSACAMCDYAAICGFDPAVKKRRRLAKKTIEDLR